MKLGSFGCLVVLSVTCFVIAPTSAQDTATVSSCPTQPRIPVTFKADCSHVKDAAQKRLCEPFIENQACKVFPAYRKITGIKLEEKCPSIQYNIYEKEDWPYPNNKGEGGLAGKCEITLMTDYSLKVRSQIGPYDLHELLHEYQWVVGPFPSEHPFFDPTQAEAAREIGDPEASQAYITRMKHELQEVDDYFGKHNAPSNKDCEMAQLYIQNNLYLEDPRSVHAFYLKLGAVPSTKTRTELQARVNRMFYIVSSGKAKEFLLAHGCPRF